MSVTRSLLLSVCIVWTFLLSCGGESVQTGPPDAPAKVAEADLVAGAEGLRYYDLKVGSGAQPQKGQKVVVHYTGWLKDGTIFDSSLRKGDPFSFVLGAGRVIRGWDIGVASMKVGGKRQLVIPYPLAYGEQGHPAGIPPRATLTFEVELLEIQ